MCNDLTRQIMLHKDDAYKALTLKLTPGLKPDSVISVRIPILRKIAKDARQEEARAFIDVLPHDYYEENNLHGAMLDGLPDKRLPENLRPRYVSCGHVRLLQ